VKLTGDLRCMGQGDESECLLGLPACFSLDRQATDRLSRNTWVLLFGLHGCCGQVKSLPLSSPAPAPGLLLIPALGIQCDVRARMNARIRQLMTEREPEMKQKMIIKRKCRLLCH
jgi:hypothetical protein